MADIFSEVDEDLRRDQYENLWKRYGKYIIAAAAMAVLVTGSAVGWKEYDKRARMEAGASFEAAKALAGSGDNTLAATAFENLAGSRYGNVARLEQAAALIASGDEAGGISIYDKISSDLSDDRFGGLATLLAAQKFLEKGDVQAARSRLEALIGVDKPWRYSAQEMIALAALIDGDIDTAIKVFKELIADDDAPEGVRSRAAEMVAALGSPR